MSVYYNEHDPFAAAWLRELMADRLIPQGDVDERSIVDVQPSDLAGYSQLHFFAGISGWPEALRLAGWGDQPVWTGSAPCQPFSSAGKRKGNADERHLWPEFFRLIEACKPPVVIGEQVASSEVLGTDLEADFVDAVSRGDCAKANKLAKQLVRSAGFRSEPRWLDGIFADLEGVGYTCRANDLPAACVGAPHVRQRLYWLADATTSRHAGTRQEAGDHRYGTHRNAHGHDGIGELAGSGGSGRMGDTDGEREGSQRGVSEGARTQRGGSSHWADTRIIQCRDGKARRIPAETQPGIQPVASGFSGGLVPGGAAGQVSLFPLAGKVPNRAGLLKGAGNAIVPQAAAEFVKTFMHATRKEQPCD